MGKFSSLFRQVGNSKDMNGFEPSLPIGSHRVALVTYKAKESDKDKTTFLEAEFIVLETNNPEVSPGAKHSWPWFINKPGFTGQYASDRAKKFLKVVQVSIGNTEDTGDFGDGLAEDFSQENPEAYGIVLDVTVTQVFEKDGRTPKLGANGNEVFNANWKPVEHDETTLEASRAAIAEFAKVPPKAPAVKTAAAPTTVTGTTARAAAAPAESAPPTTTEPAAAPAKKLGGLGSLLGKKK